MVLKTIITLQVKRKVHKSQQELTSKLKRCFKCQGLGHIDFECSNQKVIALIEENKTKEEDIRKVVESNHVQKDKEKSSLLSEFDLEKGIKVGFNVMDLVVVEEMERKKEIPQEEKPTIEEFVDIVLEEIPHGFPPMRDIQHQIDPILGLVFPNKPTYRMGRKEHKELKRQVDEFLNKGLV